MPQLKSILQERKKKPFVKKNYRPWDANGDGSCSQIEEKILSSSVTNKIDEEQKTVLTEKNTQNSIENLSIRNNEKKQNLKNNKETQENFAHNSVTEPVEPNSEEFYLMSLNGLQYKVVEILYKIAQPNAVPIIGAITTQWLSSQIGTTIGTTKMALKRLIDKKILIRGEGRTARGGYLYLEFPEKIYSKLENIMKRQT